MFLKCPFSTFNNSFDQWPKAYAKKQVVVKKYSKGTDALEVLDKYHSKQNTFFHTNNGM